MGSKLSESRLEIARSGIEDLLDAGHSFGEVEQAIADSGLSDDERADLWQFARTAWSQRFREARRDPEKGGRFRRLGRR